MHTALREDRKAHRNQIHLPRLHAILPNHPARRVTRDSSHQVGGPRVQVRRQHATGSQLQQRNARALASEGGEGGGISGDDGASGAVVVWVRVEVVVPVCLLGEENVAVEVCCCGFEGSVEGGVDGAGLGCHDEGGEEKDEEEGLSEHFDSSVVVVMECSVEVKCVEDEDFGGGWMPLIYVEQRKASPDLDDSRKYCVLAEGRL
jgi:hypothetical protein